MDSKTFRSRATYAVDMVARFMEEFPEVYCIVRMGDKDSDLDMLVGIAQKRTDPEDNEDA